MAENHARKRVRSGDDSVSPSTLAECARSPTFWHNEGTIILRVDDTLFRVHRDMLAAHFNVFNDVFTVPQPLDPEQLDGCQVMVQSGDKCDDWETALTFVYSPLDVHPWHDKITTKQLLSLAHLAHKYQGDKLFNECVRRLKAEFPETLAKFQALYPNGLCSAEVHGRLGLARHLHGLIAVITAAIELEIECILPCAYMLLSINYEPLEFLNPPVAPDGVRAILHPIAQQSLFLGYAQIHPAILQSVRRWVEPHDPAYHVWRWWCRDLHDAEIAEWGGDPDFKITDPPPCRQDFDALRDSMIHTLYNPSYSKRLFLASSQSGSPHSYIFGDLCELCADKENEFRAAVQRDFWSQLPIAFGMGKPWTELKYL